MNTDILFELVEQYDIITIYRHVSPDADALGAQFGLKQWIHTLTFPTTAAVKRRANAITTVVSTN